MNGGIDRNTLRLKRRQQFVQRAFGTPRDVQCIGAILTGKRQQHCMFRLHQRIAECRSCGQLNRGHIRQRDIASCLLRDDGCAQRFGRYRRNAGIDHYTLIGSVHIAGAANRGRAPGCRQHISERQAEGG